MAVKKRVLKLLWGVLYRLRLTGLFSDAVFTRMMYYCYTGQRLNLRQPSDFNQKIQWLKLNYHNPLWVLCADKYAVREYVRSRIGEKYLNKCIGVYERVEDIKFEALPTKFVLKATHGSGWNIVCTCKDQLNWTMVCKMMRKWLVSDFARVGREWQYRNIPHRIICESYMEESDGSQLKDYKLFTFKGDTKYIAVEFDKPDGEHFINIYDSDGKFQRDKHMGELSDESAIHLPECLEEMKFLAKKLAGDFPVCRVDLYVVDGCRIVFGELTFTPGKGCNAIEPQSFCDELGSYVELPERTVVP